MAKRFRRCKNMHDLSIKPKKVVRVSNTILHVRIGTHGEIIGTPDQIQVNSKGISKDTADRSFIVTWVRSKHHQWLIEETTVARKRMWEERTCMAGQQYRRAYFRNTVIRDSTRTNELGREQDYRPVISGYPSFYRRVWPARDGKIRAHILRIKKRVCQI